MIIGAFTGYIDGGLIAINLFVLFFIGLIIYLQRESNREGFPLVSETDDRKSYGVFGMPSPKSFKLADGTTLNAPRDNGDDRPVKGKAVLPGFGSPLQPTGANPMLDCIGPSSYAQRRDIPDVTFEGHARIVPTRAATGFSLDSADPAVIGMTVVGADGVAAGKVVDAWVDRSEYLVRYLEVELGAAPANGANRRVLLPFNMADICDGQIVVSAILGKQFADVPRLKLPDRVTFLEEDKIMGYYGGGYLYATPERQEALL
jgi:photosynthetic reaction center H subunit